MYLHQPSLTDDPSAELISGAGINPTKLASGVAETFLPLAAKLRDSRTSFGGFKPSDVAAVHEMYW